MNGVAIIGTGQTKFSKEDADIEKLLFEEISFTSEVFPAPDGDDNITIIPSLLTDITLLKINLLYFQ